MVLNIHQHILTLPKSPTKQLSITLLSRFRNLKRMRAIVAPCWMHSSVRRFCPCNSAHLRRFRISFHGQTALSTSVNSGALSLELVKGHEQMYWTTDFGVLEHALKGLKQGTVIDN